MTPTATEAKKLREILDPDWAERDPEVLEALDSVCQEALAEAFRIYEAKAKFVVVGQIYWTIADGTLVSVDPRAEKVSLGAYASEAKARDACQSLHGSSTSRELLRTWTLPVWHGNALEWRKARREALEAEQRHDGTQAERLSAIAEKGYCMKSVLTPDDLAAQCRRPINHPGTCFARYPLQGNE